MSISRLESSPEFCVKWTDIQAASQRISSHLSPTPIQPIQGQTQAYLKNEATLPTHSFKIRGALNTLLQLPDTVKQTGVVARSSGNFAQAIAYGGHQLGIPVTVVMPIGAPAIKVAAAKKWGATVIQAGHIPKEGEAVVTDIHHNTGAYRLSSYDDPRVIAGQGTVGAELIMQLPKLDTVFCPVGGGGLMAGLAIAIKTQRPDVRIIGVEPEFCNDFQQSHALGQVVSIASPQGLAEGLHVSQVGAHNWPILKALVDDVVTVTDAEIAQAVGVLWHAQGLRIETSGAVSFAAFSKHPDPQTLGTTACILSGGNIDDRQFETFCNP